MKNLHENSDPMKVFFITILVLLTNSTYCQLSKEAMRKMGPYPLFFLDSTESGMSEVQKLSPFSISNIDILKPRTAVKLFGEKGKDGAVYLTSVEFARKTYWRYFSAKSKRFNENVSSPSSDTIVQYIVDGQLLTDSSAPGILFQIGDSNLKTIDMIDREDGRFLMDNIYPKRYLVVITTKRPRQFSKRISSRS